MACWRRKRLRAMHELSVCMALLEQVADCVESHRAIGASRIMLRIGPLAGVEPALLRAAYAASRPGTCAADAELVIVNAPVRIRCASCGMEDEARPGHLACKTCGSAATQLLSGDELLLEAVDLMMDRVT